MAEPHAYPLDKAAELMGISRTTINALIHTTDPKDFLPSARAGTKRLIRPADIEAWLDRHMED